MYFCVGRKDGICSEKHETRASAEQCLLEFQKKHRLAGKVSDRMIVSAESIDEVLEELELY